jgi:hypothetical protein
MDMWLISDVSAKVQLNPLYAHQMSKMYRSWKGKVLSVYFACLPLAGSLAASDFDFTVQHLNFSHGSSCDGEERVTFLFPPCMSTAILTSPEELLAIIQCSDIHQYSESGQHNIFNLCTNSIVLDSGHSVIISSLLHKEQCKRDCSSSRQTLMSHATVFLLIHPSINRRFDGADIVGPTITGSLAGF